MLAIDFPTGKVEWNWRQSFNPIWEVALSTDANDNIILTNGSTITILNADGEVIFQINDWPITLCQSYHQVIVASDSRLYAICFTHVIAIDFY